MRRIASVFGSSPAVRLAVAGCLAASLAGCADSERLANPFSNPFQTASNNTDPMPTGTVGSGYPAGSVQSAPLNAPNPAPYRPQTAYTAPSHPNPRDYASYNAPRGSVAGWTVEGGMPIVVAHGESADIVARRYGIPEAALLRTNGFSSPAQVRPGTRLIIPVYNAALAASSGVHAGTRQQLAARDEQRRERMEARQQERPQEHPHEHLRFVKGPEPAVRTHKDAKAEATIRREEKLARIEHAPLSKPQMKAVGGPQAKIEKVALTETGSAPAPKKPLADPAPATTGRIESHMDEGRTAVAAAVAPEFRWPAHGRIIRGFAGNDGINIALPEGTPVKAVEAGVVAYAGNELKGYGNLVLIRHPNGFVSAYANNEEIDVKRGDVVKRGQVIAKSGQTGNVTTPQLHFELRKGAKPVDPTQYLAGL